MLYVIAQNIHAQKLSGVRCQNPYPLENVLSCPLNNKQSKIFDPVRVGSIFCGSGRVSHSWFGFEFEKFPLTMSNFSIFFPSGQKKFLRVRSESTRVKGGSAFYLLRVKSKLGSGQGTSLVLMTINSEVHPQELILKIRTAPF